MSSLLALFANNLLPFFLASGSGFLIGKFFQIQPRPISQVAFYIFSPCLLFQLLTANRLDTGEIARMSGFVITSSLILGALALVAGRLLRMDRQLLSAVILIAMFSNAGNYGLSVNLFAFGETALAYASLYFVTSVVLTYTVGVIIASLGSTDLKAALVGLVKVPVVYALLLAILFNTFGWSLPLPLERTVSLLASATIPVLMVLLGLQLQQVRWDGRGLALSLSNLLRLVAAPALALGLTLVFDLQGPARQAGVIEAAMPAAVTLTVLATEYNLEPAFITSAVFTSTLLSPFILTPLLAYLGA